MGLELLRPQVQEPRKMPDRDRVLVLDRQMCRRRVSATFVVLVVLNLIVYDLCLNELGDVVRWEDTDLGRTLVWTETNLSTSRVLAK